MRQVLILAALVATITTAADAQSTLSATATLSASFGSQARLSLSPASLTFADADPDTAPQVPALPGPIAITARARATRNTVVTLTVQANDDLRSGVTVLPASLISWTATGTGFVAGTLSRTSPQVVGTWVGSGIRTGTQSFLFENRWSHPTGTYSVTLVYTLASP